MVQISHIPDNIGSWFHRVWQRQIQRIWGWSHRFWSFAIPKLRLRLAPTGFKGEESFDKKA